MNNSTRNKTEIRKTSSFKTTIVYVVLPLTIISSVSLFLRLFYFPYDIPLTHDAVGYFWYAIDTTVLEKFPTDYSFPNTGWPMFLSLVFGIFDSNNFIDYMTIQRLSTIIISTLTVIPVYFLCKKFFNNSLSLLGALLFAFEPHMIQNSLLGLTDTLYIFLITVSFVLLQSSNKKLVYLSFAIAGLSSIVRYEGLVFLAVLTITFFIKFRKEKLVVLKYLFAIGIFILILLPVMNLRINDNGEDGLTSHIFSHAKVTSDISSNQSEISPNLATFLSNGFENLLKYTGWIMIPYFIIFVPIGIVLGIKTKKPELFYIILSIIILSIPALYAYSRDIQETRYLLVLMPFFSVLSLFLIERIVNKTNKQKLFCILLIMIIFTSSFVYVELKKVDLEHEREAFEISQQVAKFTKVTNKYEPESKYLKVASIGNNFPVTKNNSILEIKTLHTNYFSIMDFIKNNEKNNLTHIVTDDHNESKILKDLFLNDEKYPYLVKVYDSIEHGYKYHVKVYKINYNQFIEN